MTWVLSSHYVFGLASLILCMPRLPEDHHLKNDPTLEDQAPLRGTFTLSLSPLQAGALPQSTRKSTSDTDCQCTQLPLMMLITIKRIIIAVK